MTCSIQKCHHPVRAKLLCGMHYQRNRVHGNPLVTTPREDRIKHGHARKGHISLEFHSWASMLSRCTNPKDANFYLYGERGIAVCARWLNSFENFLTDMGPRPSKSHTIDRYPDKNGNYEPGNCRWATKLEQGNNTRRNVLLEFAGKRQTIAQWAREIGIKAATIRDRVHRYNWPTELALSAPLNTKQRSNQDERLSRKAN